MSARRILFLLITGSLVIAACSPLADNLPIELPSVDQAVQTQLAKIPSATSLPLPTAQIPTFSNPTPSSGSAELLDGLIFAGGELQQVQPDGSVNTLYSGQIEAISPDKNLGLINSNGDLWLAQFNPQSISRLTMTEQRVECCATWWNNHPQKILFLSNNLGGNTGVATSGYLTVIKQDGTGYQVLDPDHPSSGVPAVSPDGVWIAYGYGPTAWLFGGELGPQKIDPAEYGLVSLKGQSISMPAWSPDGRHLAWRWQSDLNSGSKVGVLILDLLGLTYQLGALFPSTEDFSDLSFSWSPDGRWLAYRKSSSQSEENGTYLIDTTTSNLTESRISGPGVHPEIWSPDGQRLVLLGDQTPLMSIFYLYEVSSQSLKQIGLERYQAGTTLAWSE